MNGGLISIECPREEFSCFVDVTEVRSCGGVPELPSTVCKECRVRKPITGRTVLEMVKVMPSGDQKVVRAIVFPFGIKIRV